MFCCNKRRRKLMKTILINPSRQPLYDLDRVFFIRNTFRCSIVCVLSTILPFNYGSFWSEIFNIIWISHTNSIIIIYNTFQVKNIQTLKKSLFFNVCGFYLLLCDCPNILIFIYILPNNIFQSNNKPALLIIPFDPHIVS